MSKSFGITDGKGFYMTFPNGYTVSVQFGPGNYGDNYREPSNPQAKRGAGESGSNKAEVAVWDKEGKWCPDDPFSYLSAKQVLQVMNLAAAGDEDGLRSLYSSFQGI